MAHGPRSGPVVMPVLDEISKQIIEQLQTDGRRSYAAIGKAVGLSEAAVRRRVQRLHEGGVMQIVAVTDPLKLGFRRQAMIGLRCDGDVQQIADQLADMDEIDYVVLTAGSFYCNPKGNVHGPAIAHEETVVIEIYDGPHYPQKPSWYTDERDAH